MNHEAYLQFLTALSNWLDPIIIAGFTDEISDLYWDGRSLDYVGQHIAQLVQQVCPGDVI